MNRYGRIMLTLVLAALALFIMQTPHRLQAEPKVEEYRTLILTNRTQLEALYGPTRTEQVMDGLSVLAAHPEVSGVVLMVEEDSTVATAYAAWQVEFTNTMHANAVVEAIVALTANYSNTEYLVLVGDDRVIPHYRLPDPTPSAYTEDDYSGVPVTTTVGAALADNMLLTDDFYGNRVTTTLDLPDAPELAVGRLVETPEDILAAVQTFLSYNGRAMDAGIVAGYDYMQDSAQEICATLQADWIVFDTLKGTHPGRK